MLFSLSNMQLEFTGEFSSGDAGFVFSALLEGTGAVLSLLVLFTLRGSGAVWLLSLLPESDVCSNARAEYFQ